MSNFARYQHGAPSETAEENHTPVQWGNQSGAVSVTLTNGEATTQTRVNEKYNTADLGKDTYGADDWRSTARNRMGFPTTTITEDCVVSIGGVNGRVRDFVSAGLLREVAPGQFADGTQDGPQGGSEEPQEAGSGDAAVMPDEVLATVNGALEPIPDHAMEGLVATAIRTVTGGATRDALVARIVAASGVEPTDAEQRADYIIAAYQGQADHYLTTRAGIAASDLPAFYEAAKQNPRLLEQAMRDQVNGSMKSWKKIADSYASKTAPTEAALGAAGFTTRNTSGTPEVFIGGVWCSVHGAARAGLI